MKRLTFGWLAAVAIATAAAISMLLRGPFKARRRAGGRPLGWDAAADIKQAASPVIAHEPDALR